MVKNRYIYSSIKKEKKRENRREENEKKKKRRGKSELIVFGQYIQSQRQCEMYRLRSSLELLYPTQR